MEFTAHVNLSNTATRSETKVCLLNKDNHASVRCPKVLTSVDRKKCLSKKRFCFNCTGTASKCRSHLGCSNCKCRHHTSICDNPTHLLRTATSVAKGSVIYPVVVVKVNGVKCGVEKDGMRPAFRGKEITPFCQITRREA